MPNDPKTRRNLAYGAAVLAGMLTVGGLGFCVGALTDNPLNNDRQHQSASSAAGDQETGKTHKYQNKIQYENTVDTETAPEIVVRLTEQGYATVHGDHQHFYEGFPDQDAIFAKELLLPAGQSWKESDVVSRNLAYVIVKTNGQLKVAYLDEAIQASKQSQAKTVGQLLQESRQKAKKHSRTQPNLANTISEPSQDHEGDGYVFNPADVVSEDELGYVVRHGDHFHYIFKSEIAANQKPSSAKKPGARPAKPTHPVKPANPGKTPAKPTPATPGAAGSQGLKAGSDTLSAQDLEKVKHFAKLNSFRLDQLQVKSGYIIWPHGDHFHATKLSDVELPAKPTPGQPAKTDDELEEEFEAELFRMAKMNAMKPEEVIIRDGMFIIPHGDHTHDYPIQSAGWKIYLKNRVEPIQPIADKADPQDLDRQQVRKAIAKLKDDARYYLHNNARQYARVARALDEYADHLDWSTDSTAGYLRGLEAFKNRYLTKDGKVKLDYSVTPIPESSGSEKEVSKVEKLEAKINDLVDYYHDGGDTKILTTMGDFRRRLKTGKDLDALEADVDAYAAKLKKEAEDAMGADAVAKQKDMERRLKVAKTKIDQIDPDKNVSFYVKVSNMYYELENNLQEDKLKALEAELDKFFNAQPAPEPAPTPTPAPAPDPAPKPDPEPNPGSGSDNTNPDAVSAKREEARTWYWKVDQDKAPFAVYFGFSQRMNDATTVAELEQLITDIQKYLAEHPEHKAAE